MIKDLFKHSIWQSNFYSELKEYSYNIERQDESVRKSNRGGFQSKLLDTSADILRPLITHIQNETHRYSKAAFNIDRHYAVGGMWININRHKDFNLTHTHPGCLFSGVYYITAPKDCGLLVFDNPYIDGMESHWYHNVNTNYNIYNSFRIKVKPVAYSMILFPSYYKHSVDPNNGGEDRISISFNLS